MKNAPAARSNESAKTGPHPTPQQADLPGIARASEAPPMLPKPNTRPAEALALLMKSGCLDQLTFLDDAGGWRLAAAVHVLRGLRWPIRSERVPVVLANGETASIARYSLERPVASRNQGGSIAPELAAWLVLFAVAGLLHLAARWVA